MHQDVGMTVLQGEVTAGAGDSAKRMRTFAEHYEAATGMRGQASPRRPSRSTRDRSRRPHVPPWREPKDGCDMLSFGGRLDPGRP